MESRFEVIDAFMDGERVDAAALKRALAEDEGRDYFVDAWLLREGVQDDMARDAIVVPMSARTRGVRPWLFAAAVLLCLAGGYAIGYRAGGVMTPATSVSSGGRANPAPATVAPPATSFPVPAPTRVIQVDFPAAPATGAGGE